MITNRSNEHLSSLDRNRDHADKNDPADYAHDREQDHNKIQEFISVDNTVTENGLKMSTESEKVRSNMYLTSDFDMKRDRNSASVNSGLTLCPRESKRHMLDYAMNVEPWSKRVCFWSSLHSSTYSIDHQSCVHILIIIKNFQIYLDYHVICNLHHYYNMHFKISCRN